MRTSRTRFLMAAAILSWSSAVACGGERLPVDCKDENAIGMVLSIFDIQQGVGADGLPTGSTLRVSEAVSVEETGLETRELRDGADMLRYCQAQLKLNNDEVISVLYSVAVDSNGSKDQVDQLTVCFSKYSAYGNACEAFERQ